MNKILIDKEDVVLEKITKNIEVTSNIRTNVFGITKVVINVLKSCELQLDSNLENSKLDVVFNLKPNVSLNLYENKIGNKSKVQYTFNLLDNSIINIEKFVNCTNPKEMIIVNLDGKSSSINYNFKSLATSKEVYDIVVNHNEAESKSEIKNNFVCVDNGKISVQVSGYVDKGTKKCIINQNNHIINLTNNKCEIRPNLYINEYDTEANHSALIGGFNNDELFYMQSRGISIADASKLLIRGFLLSNINNKRIIKNVEKSIKEYWR